MFDRLSKGEITKALEEMVTCCGVKEDMKPYDLVILLRKKETEGCVQEIANRLGLPIRINLSYVPNVFRPSNVNRFHSTALVETDWTGRGIAGITAQVSIPEHLPMFGTLGLQSYPLHVRVSENCHQHPHTFVAIMAHELSHVLLASLSSPHKDSELHTDLVPIILGFRSVVREGRKKTETTISGNTTTTETTTYGYLTDSQLEFASTYVTGLLDRYSHNKNCLLKLAEQVKRKLRKATRSLATFRDYFKYLDSCPPERMKKDHAQRVVQLHGQDYSHEWESRITAIRKSIEIAEAFVRSLNHYTNSSVEHLKAQTRVIELAVAELRQVTDAIAKDERLLRKYVGFSYIIGKALRRLPRGPGEA